MRKPRAMRWIEEAEARQVLVTVLSEQPPPAWCGRVRRLVRRCLARLRSGFAIERMAGWPLPQLQPAPVRRMPPGRRWR
jgi:hypothetical protein